MFSLLIGSINPLKNLNWQICVLASWPNCFYTTSYFTCNLSIVQKGIPIVKCIDLYVRVISQSCHVVYLTPPSAPHVFTRRNCSITNWCLWGSIMFSLWCDKYYMHMDWTAGVSIVLNSTKLTRSWLCGNLPFKEKNVTADLGINPRPCD